MSRRPTVQDLDEFDDDTDLPLPARALPNTGTKGAILEQITDSESSDDEQAPQLSGTSQAQTPLNIPLNPTQRGTADSPIIVTDVTPYKNWTCIYPIYIDAKRPYGTGQRRIARQKSVWWPVSQVIVEAAMRIGFRTFHEPMKTHPRDWGNPGRVKVQWKRDGRLVIPHIKTKKQLLEAIALGIQKANKSQIPLPEQIHPEHSFSPNEGKRSSAKRTLPKPPDPIPPLTERLSSLTPLAEAGVLVETVKVALGQQASAEKGDGAAGGPLGGKGKRKIVRVRG